MGKKLECSLSEAVVKAESSQQRYGKMPFLRRLFLLCTEKIKKLRKNHIIVQKGLTFALRYDKIFLLMKRSFFLRTFFAHLFINRYGKI